MTTLEELKTAWADAAWDAAWDSWIDYLAELKKTQENSDD